MNNNESEIAKKLKGSTYIGDAVYISFDGYQVWLKTTDGLEITNQIALEPGALHTMLMYIERLKCEPDNKDNEDEMGN